ncbi:MAG: 4-hydroxythreonine-4-phosphate dehydrogenase PdxA [Kangiellaceae bacterium]|nr:4-hydroxythreonine-4-phosphate dehydrogenase PdxA [Kangiellaceae bacterium]
MPNQNFELPRVAITMGEPAGIGPELIVKAAQLSFSAQLIVIGDPKVLEQTAQMLGVSLDLSTIDWQSKIEPHRSGHLWVEPISFATKVEVGKLNSQNAPCVLDILRHSNQLAMQNQVQAIVTAPVHKEILNQADDSFFGHTEFFASHADASDVVMMLATNSLRITLATTHLPLSKVPQVITKELLTTKISTILDNLENTLRRPVKLAVCGLNPHAGEGGLLGKEDDSVIAPVIKEFQQQGKQVFGPFPADTLFTPQKRDKFDVFLAMYHDQGLPVVKAFGFGQCANITLGLPYIRTSVDHGTALDIAASFQANSDSLEYAINYAIQLIQGKLPQ